MGLALRVKRQGLMVKVRVKVRVRVKVKVRLALGCNASLQSILETG